MLTNAYKVCRFQIKIRTLKRLWFTDSTIIASIQLNQVVPTIFELPVFLCYRTTAVLPKQAIDNQAKPSNAHFLIMWFINTLFSSSNDAPGNCTVISDSLLKSHARWTLLCFGDEFRIIGGDNLMNCRIMCAHSNKPAPCQCFSNYKPATLPKTLKSHKKAADFANLATGTREKRASFCSQLRCSASPSSQRIWPVKGSDRSDRPEPNSFTLIALTELISLANFSCANCDHSWLIENFFVCSLSRCLSRKDSGSNICFMLGKSANSSWIAALSRSFRF